jgi:hypothetical protein
VWARFRYPVLGPVSGERPMRATTVSDACAEDVLKYLASDTIDDIVKSCFNAI